MATVYDIRHDGKQRDCPQMSVLSSGVQAAERLRVRQQMPNKPNAAGSGMVYVLLASGRWLLLLVALLAIGPRAECLCHGAQESRIAEVSERGLVAAPIRFVGQNPQRGGVMGQRSGIVFIFAHGCSGQSKARYKRVGAVMNDAAWWARVVQARTERHDLRWKRIWVLRKEGREAAIDVKAVPGAGAEIVLTVDGELRKTRLFQSHEQAELVGAIADTRTIRGEGVDVMRIRQSRPRDGGPTLSASASTTNL